MAQDKYIKEHQKKIQKLREIVKGRKQEILDNIDLDELMMNPKMYLDRLAKEFYESNTNEFKEAINLGKKLSKKVLKGIKNDTSQVQNAEIQNEQKESSTSA